MPRRVFFSFHFDNDFWRTQQVRNMNALEGQPLCTPNTWEEVKRKGDASIRKWIDDSLVGKSCVVVLVGSETANRPWVIEEIAKGWNADKGVLAIRVHQLLDQNQRSSAAGPNPLEKVTHNKSGKSLAAIAPLKLPSGSDSRAVYASIAANVEGWIEEAIRIRQAN